MSKLEELSAAIERGKSKQVTALIEEALAEGNSPLDVLNRGMIDAMSRIGERFQANEIFVPEMLMAAKAMKKGVETLKPHLGSEDAGTIGKAVIGTVQGDLHDIGKNLVSLMIESSGFVVEDLGVDVPAERFVEAAADPAVDIVCLSSLLTTAMPAMEATVAALNASPRRSEFKIMVGGAPITQEFADKIGADAYTEDAAGAAAVARAFVTG